MLKINLYKKYLAVIFLLSNAYCMVGQRGFNSDTIAGQFVYPGLMFKPNVSVLSYHSAFYKKFNSSVLPFFCKIEHKIETGSKIAFRFRIGDLNYVNMLENKR